MSRFSLFPVLSAANDPAWALSWQATPCEIMAETAEQARRLAAGQFTVAIHPGGHLASYQSPWLNPELVQVSRRAA